MNHKIIYAVKDKSGVFQQNSSEKNRAGTNRFPETFLLLQLKTLKPENSWIIKKNPFPFKVKRKNRSNINFACHFNISP